MPFGLKNALGTFQRVIYVILATVKWQYALVYFKDVIILSYNVQQNLKTFSMVLCLFSNTGVMLN